MKKADIEFLETEINRKKRICVEVCSRMIPGVVDRDIELALGYAYHQGRVDVCEEQCLADTRAKGQA